jgi:hypothetical protein
VLVGVGVLERVLVGVGVGGGVKIGNTTISVPGSICK